MSVIQKEWSWHPASLLSGEMMIEYNRPLQIKVSEVTALEQLG